jgi:hypothetical protein
MPIDYVSIFNWVGGKCIAQVVPDAAGNWEFVYTADMTIGITYVADGCEPITHGPYAIEYSLGISSGFLFISLSALPNRYDPDLDVSNTSSVNYNDNFEQTKDIGFFDYEVSDSPTTPLTSVVVPIFDINWRMNLYCKRWAGNDAFLKVEFLDGAGSSVAAIKAEKSGQYLVLISCSVSGGAYETMPYEGWATSVNGYLVFTASTLSYQHDNPSETSNILPFTKNADMSRVVSLKISGRSDGRGYTTPAGSYVKIVPPVM